MLLRLWWLVFLGAAMVAGFVAAASAQDAPVADSGPNIRSMVIHREGEPPTVVELPDRTTDSDAPEDPGQPIDAAPGEFDLVLAKGQAPLHGTVEQFVGDVLRFTALGGDSQPLARSVLIGIDFAFGQRGTEPRPTGDIDPENDLVITYDGEVASVRVSAITQDAVITEATTFDRGEVDRIVFSPGKVQPSPTVASPEPNAGMPEASPEETPPETDWKPPKWLAKPCPENQPLDGWVRWEYETHHHNFCETEETATARFRLPKAGWLGNASSRARVSDSVAQVLFPVFECEEIFLDASTSPYRDASGDDWICEGPGGDWSGVVSADLETAQQGRQQ